MKRREMLFCLAGAAGAFLIPAVLTIASLSGIYPAQAQKAAPTDTQALARNVADILSHEGYVEAELNRKPAIVMAALEKWKTEQERADKTVKPVVPSIAADARRTDNAIVIGDPEAPKTLVEFFDFNCGFCRRTMPVVQALVERRPDIKIVLRQFPVISPDSPQIAAIALACGNQGLSRAFFKAAGEHKGPITVQAAFDMADKAGADMKRLRRDSESSEILSRIQADLRLGQSIGVAATPAWIQGTRHLSGYIPLEDLEKEADTPDGQPEASR